MILSKCEGNTLMDYQFIHLMELEGEFTGHGPVQQDGRITIHLFYVEGKRHNEY